MLRLGLLLFLEDFHFHLVLVCQPVLHLIGFLIICTLVFTNHLVHMGKQQDMLARFQDCSTGMIPLISKVFNKIKANDINTLVAHL